MDNLGEHLKYHNSNCYTLFTPHTKNNMARAHRVGATVVVLTVLYILAFFQFVSVPLVDEATAQKLIPVVSLMEC